MEASNVKAMREALEWLQARLVASVYDGTMDPYEALEKVESALSAPPRNCDIYKTVDEASDAWMALVDECDDVLDRFDWLLAEAKEGGGVK